MVRRDGVVEDGKGPRTRDIGGHVCHYRWIEIWRLADVRGVRIPLVDLARRSGNLVPQRILAVKVRIDLSILGGIESTLEEHIDLPRGGPHVVQMNRAPVDDAERLAREI